MFIKYSAPKNSNPTSLIVRFDMHLTFAQMEKNTILRRSILHEKEVDQIEYLYADDGHLMSIMERIISDVTAKQLLKSGTWIKVEKSEMGRKWVQVEQTEQIIKTIKEPEQGGFVENTWFRRLHPDYSSLIVFVYLT